MALGERLEEYLTRVGFYGEPAAVEELARTGPEALAAVVEGAETAHALLVAPDEVQEALTRQLAPLVREKMDLLADFIPLAGWFFRPLAFTRDARERLAGTAGAAETLRAAALGARTAVGVDPRGSRGARPRPSRRASNRSPRRCSPRCASA